MSSRHYITFVACLVVCAMTVAGCLTDSGGDSNKDTDNNSLTKNLSFAVSSLKLIEDYQVDLSLTIDPPAAGNEWILWSFAWPESTTTLHTSAVDQPSLNAWPFKEGDLTLTATLHDSLEVLMLGLLAPAYGSASIDVSVRKIIVDISAEQDDSYLEYTFTPTTPHQAYLWPAVRYAWDFGDNQKVTRNALEAVSHTYEEPGTYIVSLTLSAATSKGDDELYTIAVDTDTLTIQRPIIEDLTLVISPQDTVWNTSSSLTVQAQPSIDWTTYPNNVRWVIDYGDGETDEFNHYLDDRNITHQYQANGTYTLYVAIHDPVSNDLLAQDSAVITIGDLPFILESNYLSASVSVFATRHFGTLMADKTFVQSSEESKRYSFSAGTVNTVFWDGRTCTSEYSYGSGTSLTTDTITATISEDGSVLEYFEYVHFFNDSDHQGEQWSRIIRFVFEQVPLQITGTTDYGYTLEGMLAGGYVTVIEDWEKRLDPVDGTAVYNYMDSTDWSNSSQGEPSISVSFERR